MLSQNIHYLDRIQTSKLSYILILFSQNVFWTPRSAGGGRYRSTRPWWRRPGWAKEVSTAELGSFFLRWGEEWIGRCRLGSLLLFFLAVHSDYRGTFPNFFQFLPNLRRGRSGGCRRATEPPGGTAWIKIKRFGIILNFLHTFWSFSPVSMHFLTNLGRCT